jgi:Icc-related predicted phosphoesterase
VQIFYAADMHGSERVWRKFLNSASFYSVDALILGGDITGKILVPVLEEKPGRYLASLFGKIEVAKNQSQLEDLEKRLRFNGYYPYRCSSDELAKIDSDVDYRKEVMNGVMVKTAARWAAIADEKLSDTEVMVYGMAGNDDEQAVDDAFRSEHLINVESTVTRMGDYQLLSCAWGNPSPWNTPRELPEDQLQEKLERLAQGLDDELPSVFNLHIPPFDSGLDTGPDVAGVDADGMVIVKKVGGQPQQAPVGSHAVRSLIEARQPILGLHSHIHESRAVSKLGRTVCINPGSSYQDGVLDGVVVVLEQGEVKSYQLVSG